MIELILCGVAILVALSFMTCVFVYSLINSKDEEKEDDL